MAYPHDDLRTPLTSTSQFIQADDDEFDEDAIPGYSLSPTHSPLPPPSAGYQGFNVNPDNLNKGKGRGPPEQLAPPTGMGSTSSGSGGGLSGNIGASRNAGSAGTNAGAGAGAHGQRRVVGGMQVETRYTGADTLDEPIMTTIARDGMSIYNKLVQVLYPRRSGNSQEALRDWDLWGPFILCLSLALMIALNAPSDQTLGVFTGVIVLITVGSLIVTVQAKLLGGRISFFQGLCVLGYCVAPLNIAALISTFVHVIYVRAPVALLAWAWCVWASMNFLDGSKIEQQRVLLAVYPLLLFYFILAWMILIQ